MVATFQFVVIVAVMGLLSFLTDISGNVLFFIAALCIIILAIRRYHYNVRRKPLVTTRAKVLDKWSTHHYRSVKFLMANRKTIILFVYKKQYAAVQVGDDVTIKYQGPLLRSLKISDNEKELLN